MKNEMVMNGMNEELVVKSKKEEKKKVLKSVSFERVVSKKGYFGVKNEGKVILWAVRDSGNYLYYLVDEEKKEVGLKFLRMLMKKELKEKEMKKEMKKMLKKEMTLAPEECAPELGVAV